MPKSSNQAISELFATVTNITSKLVEQSKSFEQFNNQLAVVAKSIDSDSVTVEEKSPIEMITPLYTHPDFALKLPIVYRFSQQNMRFYFTTNDTKTDVEFFPSVTTILDRTMPMGFGKQKLLAELGLKGYKQMMKEKAHYGTMLHMLISDYLRSGNTQEERFFEFDSMPERVNAYVSENKIDFDTKFWSWELRKDLIALIKFCIDHAVTPISIETVGIYNHQNYRFAGAMDLICEMTIKEKGFFGEVYKSGANKGDPKETYTERRVKALIDFKSGKSGFFEDHEIQLHMYQLIAQFSLGITPEKLFNVAPKEWRDEPSYSLKDQTDSIGAYKIHHLASIFSLDYCDPHEIQIINGKFNGTGDYNQVVKSVPTKEYVLSFINKKQNTPQV